MVCAPPAARRGGRPMNAHVNPDDLSCDLDDQIAHLTRAIMLQAQEIAQTEDRDARWMAFQRLRDQHERINEAFNAGRGHVVNVCEQRLRERSERVIQFARTA